MIPTHELSLILKLRSLGSHVAIEGLTTIDQRREAVRRALLPVNHITYTVSNGKRISLGVQFAAVYGEPP